MKSFGTAFCTAAAVACALLFPCVEIYLNNRDQFTLTPWSAAGFALFGWGICCLFLFAIPALIRKTRAFPVVNALLLCFGITSLLQYLCWSGIFPETFNDDDLFLNQLTMIAFHLLFLTLPLIPAICFPRWICRNTGKIALVIVLTQAVAVAGALHSSRPQDYDFTEYAFSDETKFEFAADENVIVLVVDCMGESICKEAMKQYPELKELFRDFICFDRMTSPLPRTMYAVPSLLTGIEIPSADSDHAQYLNRACRSEKSLFQILRQYGFRVEGYPFILQTISYSPDVIDNSIPINYSVKEQSAIKIVDSALNRQIPFFLKPFLEDYYYLATDQFVTPRDPEEGASVNEPFDITFYRRLNRGFRVGTHRKGFKYLHIHGAHDPIRTDDNLELNQKTMKLRQLRGSLKIVELLISRLKEAGLYDNATIAITGDHTESYTPEVLTFFKRKNARQEELRYNSIPCKVSEIAGTVLKACIPEENVSSLFDLPPVWGDGNCRKSTPGADLVFSSWQTAGGTSFDEFEMYSKAFMLDGHKLFMEPDLDRTESTPLPENLILSARNTASGKCWESFARPEKYLYRYLVSSELALPDGVYQIFIGGQNENDNTGLWSLPEFLILENGQPRLAKEHPDTKPRPLAPGEEIRFRPLHSYPQLLLPEDATIRNDALTPGENFRLGIRLPSLSGEAVLTLALKCHSTSAGTLTIFDGINELAQFAVKEPSEMTIPLRLLPGGERILDLRFEFLPKRRNRDDVWRPRIQVQKIQLM